VGCAIALALLAIPAVAGNEIAQVVFTTATVALMSAALLLLILALALVSHLSLDCEHTLGWWSVQHAGGDALAVLAAASSVLGVWLSVRRHYIAAMLGGLATIAFVVGWYFAVQGVTIC